MLWTKHLYFSLWRFFLTDPSVLDLTRGLNHSPEPWERPHSGPYWSHFLSLEWATGWPTVPHPYERTLTHTHVYTLFLRRHPHRDNEGSHLPSHCSKWITASLDWTQRRVSLRNNGRENTIIFNSLWYPKAPGDLRQGWEKAESQFSGSRCM